MVFVDYNWTPILIPFIIAIVKYRKLDKAFRILFFFVVVGVITEVSVLLTRHLLDSRNSMLQGNFYLLSSFFLLSWYYMEVLKELIKPRILWVVIVVFEIGAITNLFIMGSLREYPSVSQSVSKILFLVYSLAFFHKIMVEAQIKRLWKDPYFLVNLAVLIYYAGNLSFSVLFNIMLNYSREFTKIALVYFSLLNALFYFILGWAFVRFGKNQSRGM